MSKPKTRGCASHSIIGSPLRELSSFQLPTRGQVARHFLYLKHGKYTSNKEVLPMLRQRLVDLWNHASIPTQPLKNIKTRLNRLEEGSRASKRGRSAVRTAKFLESLDKFFDIAFCPCQGQDFATCRCDKNERSTIRTIIPERQANSQKDVCWWNGQEGKWSQAKENRTGMSNSGETTK